MDAIVKKQDRFGDISYIRIVGVDEAHCSRQVEQLNYYGDLPEIHAKFTLLAVKKGNEWYDTLGKKIENIK